MAALLNKHINYKADIGNGACAGGEIVVKSTPPSKSHRYHQITQSTQ